AGAEFGRARGPVFRHATPPLSRDSTPQAPPTARRPQPPPPPSSRPSQGLPAQSYPPSTPPSGVPAVRRPTTSGPRSTPQPVDAATTGQTLFLVFNSQKIAIEKD